MPTWPPETPRAPSGVPSGSATASCFRGERARAPGGSLAGSGSRPRAEDCVARGYLLIPACSEQMDRGDYEAGYATAVDAAAIGERFGDPDLVWLAREEQAHALVQQGRVGEGLRLADEALVAVTAGELSPIVTGIVYCNTIAFCRNVYELRHVREWTDALTRWCERQPEMVAHNGLCLVHRAEIMTLGGAWRDALEELRRLDERFTRGALNERALGHAAYRRGEVHRLRGEFGAAEAAYREASRLGREPQPGLALLRLAQGDGDAAAAAIRRALGELTQRLERAALLPAYVEIMLAGADVEAARGACRELEEVAHRQGSDALGAMAAYARGAVAWPRATPGPPCSRCAAPGRRGRSSRPRTRPPGRASGGAGLPRAGRRGRGRAGAGGRARPLRPAGGGAGSRPRRRRSRAAGRRRWPRAHAARAAGAAPASPPARPTGDRGRAGPQRAHGGPPPENIFTKLGVSSRAAATAYAFRHRLV